MNLSMKWLNDFVSTEGIDIKKYCDVMTETGSKVEGYEEMASEIENVFVGRITKVEPHENSDHLVICQLDMGDGKEVQIVTGAPNVFPGAIVPVARPVAKLPGGVVIKSGKLRGVPSDGMLCSIGELNLTEHEMPGANNEGILILSEEEFGDKVGMNIKDALLMNDTTVEFEITSNRPDCLSVIGLARETAVSFGREYSVPTPVVKGCGDGDDIKNHLSVEIKNPDLCYRYSAKVVKNVKIAPSPLWLRMRLAASGVRPINNIVDITNYVMLEYGQPMHAFDYACLDGSSIVVRNAEEGEIFKSLDDKDHTLKSSMLVIADAKKAVALAGVMGGANSEITDSTKTVVFESAMFNGPEVRIAGKALGMRTESSARFEKGLDAENTMPALMRACELVELLGAGDVVDGVIDVYPTKREIPTLPLEADRINKFLGVNLPEEFMVETLRKLGCTVENGIITPPSFRQDLECMNDYAEEIIRIYGYNKIESTGIRAEMTQGGRTDKQKFEAGITTMLSDAGMYEIQTFSFISPSFYDKIRMPKDDSRRNSIVISNPLGEDTSIMRTTALPSMLNVLMQNKNFNNDYLRLYEPASVYIPTEEGKLPDERKVLTLGLYGDADFFTLKAYCELIFNKYKIKNVEYVAVKDNPTFHPGRCAKILVGGKEIGVIGQIHPLTADNYGFDAHQPVYAGELDLAYIYEASEKKAQYKHLPKFPASARDLSFVCDKALEVGKLENSIMKAAGKLCESVELFDIYEGVQVGEGKKSVSFRIMLRSAESTITVEQADKSVAKVLKAMENEFGIVLRS